MKKVKQCIDYLGNIAKYKYRVIWIVDIIDGLSVEVLPNIKDK